MRLTIAIFAVTLLAASGPPKTTGSAQSGNDVVEISATALLGREEIQKAVGADLGSTIIAVEVRIEPKDDKPLRVSLDDFTLLSHNDGQRSQPFTPSQIAGKHSLIVTPTSQVGMMKSQGNGPIWGGSPGTGAPRQMPGTGGGSGKGVTERGIDTKVKKDDKENPLMAVLKEKVLQEKETTEALKGLLYFPIEGKHKIKDFALLYRGPAGRLDLEFKP